MSTPDDRIEASWRHNAAAWTEAVRERRIESRRAGTDDAIVQAVLDTGARRVLDAGSGEGWLTRTLVACGIEAIGFDGSAELVERARDAGGTFLQLGYADFVAAPQSAGEAFDAVVFNFSLFTADIVPSLRAAAAILQPGGAVIIQTVHPFNDAQGGAYSDGWREEDFASMPGDFRAPMPWYFRTMSSWLNAVVHAGLEVAEVREPFNPATGKPLSLLIIARRPH